MFVIENKRECRIRSRSRIIIFPFDVKKSGLHEDQVRFSCNLVDHNANSKMAIQERSSFFESYIAIVIDLAILTIVTKRVEIAVAIITLRIVEMVVNFASRIDSLSSIIITIAHSSNSF